MKHGNEQPRNFTFYVRKVAGVLLIITGVLGLFLPFLQGIAMILAGIALLGGRPAVRRAKRLALRVLHVLRRMWR